MTDRPCKILNPRQAQVLQDAPTLTGYRHDGTFARLLCLLNVIRLSGRLGKPGTYLWEQGPAGDDHGQGTANGFELILRDQHLRPVRTRRRGDLPAEPNITWSIPLVLPGEAPDDVHAELRVLARSLVLADGRTIGEALVPDTFNVGIHARQGDSAQLRWLLEKYFPASGWKLVLDSVCQNFGSDPGTVYVASDSSTLTAAASDRHPGRVRQLADVARPSSKLQGDLLEAMMLAQCSLLIAPRRSALSEFSAVLADRPTVTPEDYLGIGPIVHDLVDIASRDHVAQMLELLDVIEESPSPDPRAAEVRRRLQHHPGRPAGAGRRNEQRGGAHVETAGTEQADILRFLEQLAPRRIDVPLVRIGSSEDGGYVLPDDLDGVTGVVAIGVGTEVSFDEHLADTGRRVLQVDHSVDGPPVQNPLFRFQRLAWAAEDSSTTLSLAGAVALIDLECPESVDADLLLKFDVEGAEWDILPTLPPLVLSRFRVITCELHHLTRLADPAWHARLSAGLHALSRHHTSVHLHANNTARLGWVMGVPVPSVVEVTFLRNDRADFSEGTVRIPTALDGPNDPARPDVVWTPFSVDPQTN